MTEECLKIDVLPVDTLSQIHAHQKSLTYLPPMSIKNKDQFKIVSLTCALIVEWLKSLLAT